MSHTHDYYKYIGGETLSIYKQVSSGNCPSGHSQCLASGSELASYIGFSSLSAQPTFAANNTPGHKHTYMMPRVDTYIAGVGRGQVSTNPSVVCDISPVYCKALNGTNNYATSITVEILETGPAISSGGSHYHEYQLTDYEVIRGITGFTTCSLGHAGCRMTTLASRYVPVYGSTYTLNTSVSTNSASVETDDIEHTDKTWVLASMKAYVNSLPLYCGIRYWRDSNYKSIAWYNPPGGATLITEDGECKVNLAGLMPGATYTWQAYAKDADDNEYTGEEKQFTTLVDPPVIFGSGEGLDYFAARQATEHITDLADGRVFMDKEGNVIYQSRLSR